MNRRSETGRSSVGACVTPRDVIIHVRDREARCDTRRMPNRRDFLEIAGATAAGALLTTAVAHADPKPPPAKPAAPIAAGDHKVVDLPFQPGKLMGLSAAMLTSHHDINYAGA